LLAFENIAMEQFGDVFDGMVLTREDGKGHVVEAHRERAVERLRQLDDHVPQCLGAGTVVTTASNRCTGRASPSVTSGA